MGRDGVKWYVFFFFFQEEDGIRGLVRSGGVGDVYKRQIDAYPFVRLHQASSVYGVASTVLGDGSVQRDGPEKGLHERATGEDVRAYYRQVLDERLLASGRVEFHRDCESLGAGAVVSLQSG